MKIRKPCALAGLYLKTNHPINEDFAELKLMRAAVAGDAAAAASFFHETKLFSSDLCVIDTPYKRYEGLSGVRAFAEEFLSVFHAQSATVIPVIQTRANGRSVTELQVDFEVDGEINQVPFFVVGDLRTQDDLDEVRIYTHATFIPDCQAYRKPLFKSSHMEMGEPGVLTGAVREYYEALHALPKVDVERIIACMADDCVFGGFNPNDSADAPQATREEMRAIYEGMATYIPRCVGMRYETVIDDGRNCVIEWVHVVSREGREERGRIAMSGISSYERNSEGYLCSIRISDYAYMEPTIDWSKVEMDKTAAEEWNYVETFPNGAPIKLR